MGMIHKSRVIDFNTFKPGEGLDMEERSMVDTHSISDLQKAIDTTMIEGLAIDDTTKQQLIKTYTMMNERGMGVSDS